jgi:hypothetical protein
MCELLVPGWTNRVLFARGVQKNLRRGVAAEETLRLRVAANGAAVSSGGVGKWAEFVWSAGRDLGNSEGRMQRAGGRIQAAD